MHKILIANKAQLMYFFLFPFNHFDLRFRSNSHCYFVLTNSTKKLQIYTQCPQCIIKNLQKRHFACYKRILMIRWVGAIKYRWFSFRLVMKIDESRIITKDNKKLKLKYINIYLKIFVLKRNFFLIPALCDRNKRKQKGA